MGNEELIGIAKSVVKPKRISREVSTGTIGCALVTGKGNVYTGVCIDASCGIGFCAEHSAIASMVTNGEFKIRKIVAVSQSGKIFPPCGRCRELMCQISGDALGIEIIVGKNKVLKLKELLPSPWQKV
ncbi:MAG: cytidine deaminase [Candidatus Diapherotrites archaeon]|uniref:Cytidine deaminase n=1 Tax=Candidatus Iainarchaeum sp. TaxID=3101447 RepID=A0A7J4KWH4_9ARCH|nr:cytidine deaminase [Candidatus Diapherotrites archaeon]HIH21153.1 cytidine deaminase [Candidatus Diapherotrites archaeon]HIH33459.1 cytidine deaminase [Candidatus Diapherotrites archaeon]